MNSTRQRLPNRRECHIETLEVAGQEFTACVGFDTGMERLIPYQPERESRRERVSQFSGAERNWLMPLARKLRAEARRDAR